MHRADTEPPGSRIGSAHDSFGRLWAELKTIRPRRGWLCVLGIACLLLLADTWCVTTGILLPSDRSLWNAYATGLGPPNFRIVEAFSLVGVVKNSSAVLTIAVVVLTSVAAVALAVRGLRLTGVMLAVAVAGAGAIAHLLKLLVNRSGPSLTPWTPIGHTFPSGTAAVAVAFFGSLAYVSYHRLVVVRWAAIVICVLGTTALVAASLTYHYPTEVIGGILTGLVWLGLVVVVLWEPIHLELRREHRDGCDAIR